jgi:cytochrome c-type biogenesis protein CcmE
MHDDGGQNMNVVYRGPKPGNFEQAEAVVAIGKFHGDALQSDQLLVKCPSKYESEYPGAKEHPAGVPMGPGARLDEAPPPAPAASGTGS